jgi:HAD superfamily hydrolase (TIGR01509 family)
VIKAVVFDFFGVFTVDLFDNFLDRSMPGWRVKEAFFYGLSRQVDTGAISLGQFYEKVHDATGVDARQVGPMVRDGFALNKGLVDYIRAEIKPKYKVGLLSNSSFEFIEPILDDYKLKDLFDAVTVSSVVGHAKPDREIYEAAAKKLQVEFDQMVFIDDREPYAAAAANLGIHAIVYRNLDQLKRSLAEI